MKKKIKEIEVKENRRVVNTDKVKSISESIKELGLINPITITNNNVLIAGLHRLQACKLLEYVEIECTIIDSNDLLKIEMIEIDENLMRNELHWSEQDEQLARRKVIYEMMYPETKKGGDRSKTTKCRFDTEAQTLDPEVADFFGIGLDEEVKKSFTEDTSFKTGKDSRTIQRSIERGVKITEEVKPLLKELDLTKTEGSELAKLGAEKQIQVMEAKKDKPNVPIKNIIKTIKNEEKRTEQIDARKVEIKIGNNIFENKDALSFIETLEDNSIDCLLIDPPYGIEYTDTRDSGKLEYKDGKEYAFKLLDNVLENLKVKLKPNAHLYIFTSQSNMFEFKTIISKYYSVEYTPLIWVKNNHTMCDFKTHYASKYETIWFAKNGEGRFLNNPVSPDVLNFAIPTHKVHSAQKPIELLEHLINNSTIEGETVCDLFSGSGSCYLATTKNNRRFVGCEMDESIFKTALNNIKNKE